MSAANEVIRFADDGLFCVVWADGQVVRFPTRYDHNTLPVGDDLTAAELQIVEGWLAS